MTTTRLILPALARVAVVILAVGYERLAVFNIRVSLTQRSQTPLEAPIYVTHVSARIRRRPLIRLRVVLDEVVVTGVIVQLEVDRQDAMARRLGASRLDDDHKLDSHGGDASGAKERVGEGDARSRDYYCIAWHAWIRDQHIVRAFVEQRIRFLVRIPGKKILQVIKAINKPMGEPVNEAVS